MFVRSSAVWQCLSCRTGTSYRLWAKERMIVVVVFATHIHPAHCLYNPLELERRLIDSGVLLSSKSSAAGEQADRGGGGGEGDRHLSGQGVR